MDSDSKLLSPKSNLEIVNKNTLTTTTDDFISYK